MKIEVKGNVFYDDELEVQSDELNQWLNDEVFPLLAETSPVIDEFMRPYRWFVDMGTCKVTMEREYVEQSTSWAMKTEKINITL